MAEPVQLLAALDQKAEDTLRAWDTAALFRLAEFLILWEAENFLLVE